MTIAQSTTIQAYQLRKGGTPARMAILRMIAADSANNRNPYTRLQAGDWRGARNWTMKNYAATYCAELRQGFSNQSPIWYSHGGEQFRNERDACEVLRMRHTGWYTDNYQEETVVGIIASLPHGRYIAGYRWTSNDERVYFGEVFNNERDAALMADERARVFAANCRDSEEIEYEEYFEDFKVLAGESVRIEAIEDNAGGLHLAVIEGDTCTHFFSGFEHGGGDRAPTMQEEIESAATEGVRGWDGDAEDPQTSYDYFLAHDYGYKIIGEWMDGAVVVYTDAMDNAGHRWSRTGYDD